MCNRSAHHARRSRLSSCQKIGEDMMTKITVKIVTLPYHVCENASSFLDHTGHMRCTWSALLRILRRTLYCCRYSQVHVYAPVSASVCLRSAQALKVSLAKCTRPKYCTCCAAQCKLRCLLPYTALRSSGCADSCRPCVYRPPPTWSTCAYKDRHTQQ